MPHSVVYLQLLWNNFSSRAPLAAIINLFAGLVAVGA